MDSHNPVRGTWFFEVKTMRWLQSAAIVFLLVSFMGCNPFRNNIGGEGPEAEVDINEAPTAAFTASVESGDAPLVVNFTDRSINGSATITEWQWEFGDGNTSSAQNPQHTFNTPGTYSVSLTVVSADGSDVEAKTDFINVASAEVAMKVSVVDTNGVLLDDVTIGSTDFEIIEQQAGESGVELAVRPNEQDGVIKVSKDGYVSNYIFMEGVALEQSKVIVLKEKATPILINGFRGGRFTGADGTGVEIPGESLLRADGSTVTGEVELYITPIDISDPLEEGAFPGSFYGVSDIGEPQDQLFSYGVFDITFEENGEELQLADSALAVLTLPLYATKSYTDEDLVDGDTIPLWYLDVETGLWIYESEGQVIEDPLSPNGLSLQATTSHFTTFNSDINPPGLGRGGSGGGGGSGGSGGSNVCRLSIDLIGAEVGENYLYSVVYSRPGWPASRSDRAFSYTGAPLGQNILRGYYVTITVSQGDTEGSSSFFCNGADVNTSITLGDQPPEIKDFNLRVEPVFDRIGGFSEIIYNRIYVGGYWVGAEAGIIDSEILTAPLILGRGVYKQITYEFDEPSPLVFSATVSNEFGTDTTATSVQFIDEHPPILGYSYAFYDVDVNLTWISWSNVEGADEVSIYQLNELTDPPGNPILTNTELNSSDELEFIQGEYTGYLRLDFSNRYGTTTEYIPIGGADCPPNSDVCVPES
ncbi:PKD domain-containing protein [Aliikangiella marina]|uniref:PKD domain-containing protein n=1 Tax=Aliikangiella marina TaxID=1712262 RepID=UPI001AEE01B6|nr:PKD domain-containing protein [Aliikangiella marina]